MREEQSKREIRSQNKNTQNCLWSGDSPWHSTGSQPVFLNFTPKKNGFVLSWSTGKSLRKLTVRALIPPGMGWRQGANFWAGRWALPWGTGKGKGFWQEQEKICPETKAAHSWGMAWATWRLLRLFKVKSICVSFCFISFFFLILIFKIFLGVVVMFPWSWGHFPFGVFEELLHDLGTEHWEEQRAVPERLRKLLSFKCFLWACVPWAGILPLWRGLSGGRGWILEHLFFPFLLLFMGCFRLWTGPLKSWIIPVLREDCKRCGAGGRQLQTINWHFCTAGNFLVWEESFYFQVQEIWDSLHQVSTGPCKKTELAQMNSVTPVKSC